MNQLHRSSGLKPLNSIRKLLNFMHMRFTLFLYTSMAYKAFIKLHKIKYACFLFFCFCCWKRLILEFEQCSYVWIQRIKHDRRVVWSHLLNIFVIFLSCQTLALKAFEITDPTTHRTLFHFTFFFTNYHRRKSANVCRI